MAQAYRIKSVVVLARGLATLVREFTFAAGEAILWHRHSAVEDHGYLLAGALTLETRDPSMQTELAAGDSCVVPAGVVHRLANRGEADARLVLVQHGGAYDFLAEAETTESVEPRG